MKILNLLCLFLLCAGSGFGADWYISPTGNDTTGDGSESTPYKTFGKAYSLMADTDTCYVADGAYTEDDGAYAYLSMGSDKTVTFEGSSQDKSLVTYNGPASGSYHIRLAAGMLLKTATFKYMTITASAANTYAFFIDTNSTTVGPKLVVDNCTISTGKTNGSLLYVEDSTDGSEVTDITISNSTITSNGTGVCLWTESIDNVTLDTCVITSGTNPVIKVTADLGSIDVKDCTIDDSGVSVEYVVQTSAVDAAIDYIRFTGNTCALGMRGVIVDEFADTAIIEDNTMTITNNATASHCFMIGNDSQTTTNPIANCSIQNNTITYAGTHTGHAVLVGGNVNNAEVSYNKIIGTGLATDNAFGIVLKGNGNNVHHNTVKARVPLIIKGSLYNKVFNNTFLCTGATGSRALELLDDTDTTKGNYFCNNIFDGSGGLYAVYYQNNAANNNRFEYNCYVLGATSMFYDGAANRASVAAMQTNLWASAALLWTDNGTGSVESSPRFMDASINDYRLASSSPCINTGKQTISSGYTDIGEWQRKSEVSGRFYRGRYDPN